METSWEDAGENTMNESIIWGKQFELDKHYQGTHKSSKPRKMMGRAGCSWIWPSWNIVAFFTAIRLIISMVSSGQTLPQNSILISWCVKPLEKYMAYKYQEKSSSLTTKPQAFAHSSVPYRHIYPSKTKSLSAEDAKTQCHQKPV